MTSAADHGAGQLLSIGQVKALTGVRESTIRHWEREFNDLLNTVKTKGNQRWFTPEAVQKIERIRELVEEQGLTLSGVREQLEEQVSATSNGRGRQHLDELASQQEIRKVFFEK